MSAYGYGDENFDGMSADMIAPKQDMKFREMLASDKFWYGAELVTTRGVPEPGDKPKLLELGEALAADPRIAWISVTDNPGGNPMLPPDWLANLLQSKRTEIVIHLTCKDLNRNGLESSAWRYAAQGFENILALTGDYPANGFHGLARPVFDLDSVSLIAMLQAMNGGLEVAKPNGKTDRSPRPISTSAAPCRRSNGRNAS